MKKRAFLLALAAAWSGAVAPMGGCSGQKTENYQAEQPPAAETAAQETTAAGAAAGESSEKLEAADVQVFIAASLNGAMTELADLYNKTQPDVHIRLNADSSGTLMRQIQEGAACDLFFSAAVKQLDQLDQDGLIMDGTRVDLLNNKVVLITGKDSGTAVTGFEDMDKAKSIAFADGSVPVGRYTRQILVNLGIMETTDDVSEITTAEISRALGGVEINECGNVSKVKEAVKEGSNEIGAVYYSDAFSVKGDVKILEEAGNELSGDIVYSAALVKNDDASEAEAMAARDFLAFLQTDMAKAVFEKYMFVFSH